jgi:hypothetical protein
VHAKAFTNIFGRYISNLDPYYILALAETASFHQVSVLRDAIWKYLALQTSIRVKIPVSTVHTIATCPRHSINRLDLITKATGCGLTFVVA